MKRVPQVLVAGAGPVGMTAGICLFNNGIDFVIVDKAGGPCTHSKACLISPETAEFLHGLDLLDQVMEKALKIRTVQLYSGSERLANLGLSSLPNQFPFILSIRQSDLEDILLERLQEFHKDVLWKHRISSFKEKEDGLSVKVDCLRRPHEEHSTERKEPFVKRRITIKPNVIIAADGFYSLIRRLQNIDYETVGDNMSSLLFETKRNPLEDPVLKIGFSSKGTSSYVPLPHGFGRYGFTTDTIARSPSDRISEDENYSEDRTQFPELKNRNLRALLKDRMPYQAESVKAVTWRASVPFGAQLADRIWENRVFLMGDAARSGFPSGAKSLNLGLPESGKVVEAMRSYLNDGNEAGLEECAAAIRKEWEELSSLGGNPSDSKTENRESSKDLGNILQALPLTGKDLEYAAHKLEKLIGWSHSN